MCTSLEEEVNKEIDVDQAENYSTRQEQRRYVRYFKKRFVES